jgi:ADP-ribose pyrophosphatase YjhB (NUDIX family)
MSLAQQIARWADELRDLSAMGLRFADSIYDTERYQRVQTISIAMMALATNRPVETVEPLREPVFSRPTPLCTGDAAVIDDDGRILLVKRADNRKWAMPGGALEVGETPAEGVLRELQEETGLICEAIGLVGVFDSRRVGSKNPHHLYMLTFLCKPLAGLDQTLKIDPNEILECSWFPEGELPDPIHDGHGSRIPLVFQYWKSKHQSYID